MNQPNVLWFITSLHVGGAEMTLLKVLPSLHTGHHTVCCIGTLGPIGRLLEQAGVKVYYLNISSAIDLRVFSRFWKVLTRTKPDMLITFLPHAAIIGRFVGRAWGVKKIICSVRDKHIDRPFLQFLDRISSFLVTQYVPNSLALKEYLIGHGIAEHELTVIPNGVEIKTADPSNRAAVRDKYHIPPQHIIIGTVANFRTQKDYPTLLRAFAILNIPNSRLLCVGTGPDKHKIIGLIEHLHIKDKVLMITDQIDTTPLLAAIDIFVLSSLHEGMSNALLEAMAMKKAIVATDIPENQELISDNIHGLLFPVQNVDALAAAITKYIDNQVLRNQMSQAAYQKVAAEYAIKHTISQFENLILSNA